MEKVHIYIYRYKTANKPKIKFWLRRNGKLKISNFMMNKGSSVLEWSPNIYDTQPTGVTNLLLTSSMAKGEFAKATNATRHTLNKMTSAISDEYILFTCTDYTDSFINFKMFILITICSDWKPVNVMF